MSIHNASTLKDAITNLLSVYKLDAKLAEKKILSVWPQLMGKMIANHTKDIFINKDKLFVRLDSAALRNELLLSKSKIITLLNKEAGREVITDIIFQ